MTLNPLNPTILAHLRRADLSEQEWDRLQDMLKEQDTTTVPTIAKI